MRWVKQLLLIAYKNAGGDICLEDALIEMIRRGKSIPGGVCRFWDACGAGVSTGIFILIICEATPLSKGSWGLANLMTSGSIGAIGQIGGVVVVKEIHI